MPRWYIVGGLAVGALVVVAGPLWARQQPAHVVGKDGLTLRGQVAADGPRVRVLVKDKNATLPARPFLVTLTGGQRYQVRMTSAALDSFLVVQDGAGNQVAFDDDSGGGLDAELT